MNSRRFAFAASLSAVFFLGCASAPDVSEDENVESAESALKRSCYDDDDAGCDCGGPGKHVFEITSFDAASKTLYGYNAQGGELAAQVTASTQFRLANLSRFIPQDPVRPALIAYNFAVRRGAPAAILNAVSALASQGVNARVGVRPNGTLRAFRPVP